MDERTLHVSDEPTHVARSLFDRGTKAHTCPNFREWRFNDITRPRLESIDLANGQNLAEGATIRSAMSQHATPTDDSSTRVPDTGHDVSNITGSELPSVLSHLLARESDFRKFLRRRITDEALAEDLLQESLIRAVQQQHTLRRSDQMVAWFYRILRNAVVDYYRARAATDRKIEAFAQELMASESDRSPAFDELRPAVCACLKRLMPSLRPAYGQLLNRIDLNGESMAAVAKDLGVTVNNLTVRLHRARQALRKTLEESCGICTKHGCLNCTCD